MTTQRTYTINGRYATPKEYAELASVWLPKMQAERDRARGIAVALEQQVAGDEFRALLLLFLSHTHIGVSNEDIDVEGRRFPAPAPLRAALAELMEADR